MRKTILGCVLAATLILALCGCAGKEPKVAEDMFVVAVELQNADGVYSVSQQAMLGSRELSGGTACNADGSPMKDTVYFQFPAGELPPEVTRESFSFSLVLSDTLEWKPDSPPEQLARTNPSDSFTPAYGCMYRYQVVGSFAEGFRLVRCP